MLLNKPTSSKLDNLQNQKHNSSVLDSQISDDKSLVVKYLSGLYSKYTILDKLQCYR